MRHGMIFVFLFLLITSSGVKAHELDIMPRSQDRIVWCWAAVSEMALKHFGVPAVNPGGYYQCGVVAMLGGQCWYNCQLCVTAIGNTTNMAEILNRYQRVARNHGYHGTFYSATPNGRLPLSAIHDELDAGRPVVAGISPSGLGPYYPSGMAEHVVLIIGYDADHNNRLIINDPMPYAAVGFDPYQAIGAWHQQAGQYVVSYDRLVSDLGYRESITFR